MSMIDLIGFDADDTLWHNEVLYTRSQERFAALLSPYDLDGRALEELFAVEMKNLPYYGYGIKAFTLSMIETAIRLTEGEIRGAEVQRILDLAGAMLRAPVEVFDDVPAVLAELSKTHRLMLITKGDLGDQERKLARSGLAPYFECVEIVSDKTPEAYRRLLERHQVEASRFLMVGNSLRSDILPVVALGGHAVYIPYHTTWAHEAAGTAGEIPAGTIELECIGQLAGVVQRLSGWSHGR